MAVHVKWLNPQIENDYNIHVYFNDGLTLCGLAHEGGTESIEQDFVVTKSKITCLQCLDIIVFCKSIKNTECGLKL